MTNKDQQQLGKTLWNIADDLRGAMNAVNNVSMASKIISETIESGLIKSSDPENSSKKFASYIPFWA